MCEMGRWVKKGKESAVSKTVGREREREREREKKREKEREGVKG